MNVNKCCLVNKIQNLNQGKTILSWLKDLQYLKDSESPKEVAYAMKIDETTRLTS